MSASKKMEEKSANYPNDRHERDFAQDLQLNRILLQLVGGWPAARLGFLSKIAILLTTLFILFILVPQGCYVLVEKDSTAKLRLYGQLIFTVMAMTKYGLLFARQTTIESCIESIRNDWRQSGDMDLCRLIMLNYSQSSKVFTKCYTAFTFAGVSFYTWVLPFLDNKNHDTIQGFTTARPVAYPSEFFVFDMQKSPMYEIVLIGHAISMCIVVCTIHCGICTLTVKFVMHACSQYEIVIAFVRNVDAHPSDEDIYAVDKINKRANEILIERKIANIVRRHLHANAFVARIEKTLNEMCLVDLVGSSINICFLGFYLLGAWETSATIPFVNYFVLWNTFVMNIFVLCYIGEHLAMQSKQVGMASYMINWWKLPNTQVRALIMIIATSHIPLKFTAGKIFSLSLPTFGAVMKGALAYLNAFRALI